MSGDESGTDSSAFTRRHARTEVRRAVRVKCAVWSQFRTLYTRDVSRGGLYLHSDAPLAMGTEVTIVVDLPDRSEVELPARVVRRDEGEGSGMGFEFDEIPGEVRRRLESLLVGADEAADDDLEAIIEPQTDDEAAVLAQLMEVRHAMRAAAPEEVLAISRGAGPEQVRDAYHGMLKRYHPDVFGRYRATAIKEAANEIVYFVRRSFEQMAHPQEVPAAPSAPAITEAARAPSTPTAPRLPARPLLEDDLFEMAAEQERGEQPVGLELSGEKAAHDGQQALKDGEYSRAKVLLADALDHDPRNVSLRAALHLTTAYEAKQAGNDEEARAHFEKVLLFDKQCAEAIAELRSFEEAKKSGLLGKLFRKKGSK